MKESEYYAYSEMRRYKEFIERVKSERRHVGDMESAHYCDEKITAIDECMKILKKECRLIFG